LHTCFEDSRRLTGFNRFTAGTAAVLSGLGPAASDAKAHQRWRVVAKRICDALSWGECRPLFRTHAGGVDLVVPCPPDRMYTATEVNEYAWEVTGGLAQETGRSAFDRVHCFGSEDEAIDYFRGMDAAEREPSHESLRAESRRRGVPILIDDDELSLGAGTGSVTYPLRAVPPVAGVAWQHVHAIPTVLITGSNGKTTTTRLVAAMLEAWSPAYAKRIGICCTEGVQISREWTRRGDYSGPGGARLVLRDQRVAAAVLETARGGILRRGLAVEHADVAVVTNITADHFGEYGVDSLDDLAEVKLTLAHALGESGTLVVNADDPVLLSRAMQCRGRRALFSLADDHPALTNHRAQGGMTCGIRNGQLWLSQNGGVFSLGEVAAMPLTVGGAADYNTANLAAASLAAAALGVAPEIIAGVATSFGSGRGDNPGRLERWTLADVTVLIDYAHNPDGLARLLDVSRTLLRGRGRMRLLLGQAGNRDDAAIAELAATAAAAQPDSIVIKELPDMLRGRALGEVPQLIHRALIGAGFAPTRIAFEADEIAASLRLLSEAAAGDVIVLPVHQAKAKTRLAGILDAMERAGWRAHDPLLPVGDS
jgi:UDP-N-acetylmuramyl tripeptide synthase